MSTALGIATVTWLLKNLLDNGLAAVSAETGLGDLVVSAVPPDRITVGAEERPQLNLYLYRLTPNTGYRALSRPPNGAGGPDGAARLAYDLHYLITAYGDGPLQAEVLLGSAVQVLQATPALTREAIRATIAAASGDGHSALPAALARQTADDLAAALESVTISPHFLSMEDMLKIWSALQSKYRLSLTYQASVVLTDRTATAREPHIEKKPEAARAATTRR